MVVLTAGEILYKTTATAHVLDAAPDHLVGQYQGLYTGAATSGTMLAAPIGTAVYATAPGAAVAAVRRWPACSRGRRRGAQLGSAKPGSVLLEDLPERRLGLELAEHADAAEPGAVDQEVRRRQVELHRHGVRRRRGGR